MFAQQSVARLVVIGSLLSFSNLVAANSEARLDVVAPRATLGRSTDQQVAQSAAEAAARPNSEAAWVAFGNALMQKGRETADAAYCGRAEQAFRKALSIDPHSLQALVGMAWVNGVRHEFEASIDWAKKAIAVDPKCVDAFGLIGDAHLEMGEYDAAFDDYQKMLDQRPDLSSYGRSAHLLFVTGDTRKATWLMFKAIAAGSPYGENTAWCRAQLALMYYAQGAYMPAEQVLTEGLKKVPNDYRLLAAIGKVKSAEKDYEAAIGYYRKSIAIAPQQDVVAALGDVYAVAGKLEEAKQQYALVDTIARLNKANGVRGDMLTARFYADHDRNLAEALQLAEEEYKTRKNAYQADTLAWCYFKNGRLEEAERFEKIALSRGTPEAIFYFHKGMIDAKVGDRHGAQLALYQAMSTNSSFDVLQTPVAMKRLAELGGATPGAQDLVSAAHRN
jgi:tetratricopeptide (TPR) repeat protein